ncbi:hypothetical protein PG984_009850 [Apiospora sp. TS-2023a]
MAFNPPITSISQVRDMEPTDSTRILSSPPSDNTSTSRTMSILSRTQEVNAQLHQNEPNLDIVPADDTGVSVDTTKRLRYRVFAPWKWELASLGLCIATNVAMFVVLTRYNRQHLLNWGYYINLNTILSILSTVQRATLLTLLTSIISQVKWLWVGNQPRPLQHLHVMDFASRSAWGAISATPLALKTNPRLLATVLMILISLAIGPFVQQAIGTEPCAEPVPGQAMIPYARYVYMPIPDDVVNTRPPSDIYTNIYSSLMDPAGLASILHFQCTTGNCTFNTHGDPTNSKGIDDAQAFSTMALCHKCINVTHLISSEWTLDSDTTLFGNSRRCLTYSVPNTLYNGFSNGGGLQSIRFYDDGSINTVFRSVFSNLTWAGNAIPQDVQDISTSALANITILTCNSKRCNGQRNDICASTCTLYPCIRSYTVSITNGQLFQEQISTSPAVTSGWVLGAIYTSDPAKDYPNLVFGDFDGYPSDWVAAKSPCRIGDNVYTLQNVSSGFKPNTTWSCTPAPNTDRRNCESMTDPQNCIYRQDTRHGQAVSNVLNRYFTQECAILNDTLECDNSASALQENVGDVLFRRGNVTTETIDEYFGAVAGSISNQYRNHYGRTPPKSWVASPEDQPFGEVHGVVLQTKTCNTIHLQWLAFPTAITTITAAILVWTMADSWGKRRNRPVWKDHVLPFLFYSHRFKRGADDSTANEESHTDGRISEDDDERLLETDEMEKLAAKLQVRFEWPGDGDTKEEATPRRRKGLRDVDIDSLLQE